MQCHGRTITLALAVLGLVFTLGASASAQLGSQVRMPKYDEPADIADLPMLGRWTINMAKSTNNGSRANSDTFTWIFQVEGDKIRHDIYDVYPADKPTSPNVKGISNLMYFDRQAGPEGSN